MTRDISNRYLTRGLGDACGHRFEDAYPWPTCEAHYNLTMSYSDFYSWVWDGQYGAHGNAHIWLGGVVDCADEYAEIAGLVGEATAAKLAVLAFTHRKNMYRDGIWYCASEVSGSQRREQEAVSEDFTD